MTVQKISVIVPAYNAEKTIEKTIRSLLAQDWPDFEVIVVDDGSTDRTAEICAGFCETAEEDQGNIPRSAASETTEADQGIVPCFTKQIRVLSQANAGPAAARNLALQNARGDLICFVDADGPPIPVDVTSTVSPQSFPENVRNSLLKPNSRGSSR